MGFGSGVSVLSLVEPRSPSECPCRFTARFFLNLRFIANYQSAEVFESHPQNFESTPLRTRGIQKPGPRATNNFVDLEIRKTVYSSGASPNEEEIDQGDIIHLEVLDSQVHRM